MSTTVLTTESICLIALSRISPGGQKGDPLHALLRGNLPAALNTLATRVSMDGRRRLLSREFDFTIDAPSQSVDLSSATSANEPLLLPSDPTNGNYLPFMACRIGGIDAYMIADRQGLAIKELDDGYLYYAIESQKLYLNSQSPLSGQVAIVGSFIPAIDLTTETIPSLPPEFEDDIVAMLVQTFTSAQQQAAA